MQNSIKLFCVICAAPVLLHICCNCICVPSLYARSIGVMQVPVPVHNVARRGAKGAMPPEIFGKYSHFVL